MVLYDPERKWLTDGACRSDSPDDQFFAETGALNRAPGVRTQAAWDRAKEICQGCPVMHQCRRDTLGEPYGVWGGYDQYQRFLIRQALHKAIGRWPKQRRLAWAQELYRLRESDMKYRDMQVLTGIPEVPAMRLIREWERHLRDQEEVAEEVVDVPVVELEPKKAPFPDAMGKRHCWVRNNGIVQDAFYRAQTGDGSWIKIQLSNRGRRSATIKWIPTEDVQIYHPQPVVIQEFAGRPDSPNGNARKTHCKNNHEFTAENTHVDKRGWRQCLTCRDARKASKAA